MAFKSVQITRNHESGIKDGFRTYVRPRLSRAAGRKFIRGAVIALDFGSRGLLIGQKIQNDNSNKKERS